MNGDALWTWLSERVTKFDPDQPRANDGKWSAGGGGGGGGTPSPRERMRPGGDLHERAKASLGDSAFVARHAERLSRAGDEARSNFPGERAHSEEAHQAALNHTHGEAMRIHAEEEAIGGDAHLHEVAAEARSVSRAGGDYLTEQHAAAMSAVGEEKQRIATDRAARENEDRAIAAGHLSQEPRDIADRYLAGRQERDAAIGQHAAALDQAHREAADALAALHEYSSEEHNGLSFEHHLTDEFHDSQRALHEATGHVDDVNYERHTAQRELPAHPDQLLAEDQPDRIAHPDESNHELSDEEYGRQLAAHEGWRSAAEAKYNEALSAHRAEFQRRADVAQTALERLHEHQVAAHAGLKAVHSEGEKAHKDASRKLGKMDAEGLVHEHAFAHHARDENGDVIDGSHSAAHAAAESMLDHASSRVGENGAHDLSDPLNALKDESRSTAAALRDLGKITGRAPRLPAKPKKSANRPGVESGASVWSMAAPARYKLTLTKLDFLSLVDTPAQETAAIRLVKRKDGASEMDATLHARVVKWTEGSDPLVYCWAFTCTDESGQPYHDLQGDAITPDFIKAAEEFIKAGGAVDEMHAGEQKSKIAFAYPMDPDIAKAMLGEAAGAAVKQSGLMVAIRPTADQLAKIKSGDYTGVSIAGTGIRELVKAAAMKCPSCGAYVTPDSDGNCPKCGKTMKSIAKTIREEDGKYVLYTADGSKKLSTHDTKAGAEAQERAIEANKRLRKRRPPVRKQAVLTSSEQGHQHQIDLDDPADGWTDQLTTSYNTAEGADAGHCHAWIYDAATGKITIAEDSGHSHTVDAVVPADVIRQAALNESGERCPSCGQMCEADCRFCPKCGCAMDRRDAVPMAAPDDDDKSGPSVVVISARAPEPISTPRGATPTVKADKEPIAMADPNDRIKTLEAENAQLKKMASLTDAQRAHISKLDDTDAANFLNMNNSQRDAILAEIAKADEIVYESQYTKRVYRKSTPLEIIEAAREADASKSAREQLDIAKRELEFSKRGETVLKNWPMGAKRDLRARIMKAVDGEFKDPAEHEEAVKALKSSDFAFEQLTIAKGINPHVEPGDAPQTPKAQLEALTAEYAKTHNVPIHKAAALVLDTPAGAALYAKLPVGHA